MSMKQGKFLRFNSFMAFGALVLAIPGNAAKPNAEENQYMRTTFLMAMGHPGSVSPVPSPLPNTKRRRELYISWGYNKDWYSNNDMHFHQPAINNDFTLYSVRAHDNPGRWAGVFSGH